MTKSEILEALKKGEVNVSEAAELLADVEPAPIRGVATQFADSKQFLKAAKAVEVSDGNGLSAKLSPRVFSTGSYGWSSNGKLIVTLPDGKAVRVQGSINLVVIGSKPLAA